MRNLNEHKCFRSVKFDQFMHLKTNFNDLDTRLRHWSLINLMMLPDWEILERTNKNLTTIFTRMRERHLRQYLDELAIESHIGDHW